MNTLTKRIGGNVALLAVMAATAGLLSIGAHRAADTSGRSELRLKQDIFHMAAAVRSGAQYGAAGEMLETTHGVSGAHHTDGVHKKRDLVEVQDAVLHREYRPHDAPGTR